MGSRILIEILILLSPFAVFGLYRMAVAEAAAEGRKPWPVQRLFIIGFVLAILAWLVLLVVDKREVSGEMCPGKSELVNGKIVQGPDVPCERDVKDIGIPGSADPGIGTDPSDAPDGSDG